MWNSLGSPPSNNEIEVSVMGPGYGESVVVHLGKGDWLVVDSCVDTMDSTRPVAPLRYLQRLGVRLDEAVKFIVASHWDDDHIRGLADVVEASPSARFICSRVLPDEKFTCFVEAFAVGLSNTDGANVRNIRRILQLLHDRGASIVGAGPARQLSASPRIMTWSPSDLDGDEFFHYVAELHPKAREGLRKAIPPSSNLSSVVLTIDWDDTAVLLAADMETTRNTRRGWDAVISEISLIGAKKAPLVKIPHHGSNTGHHAGMWSELLNQRPISVLTPFNRGPLASRPPTTSDVRRIARLSGQMYATARHRAPAAIEMEVAVQRSLREGGITFTSPKTSMGIVRHRFVAGGQWRTEQFGAAYRIK